MTTTAIIAAAILALIGALVWAVSRLAHRSGGLEAGKNAAEEGDAARRVRDEVEIDTRHLSDDDLAERLRKWTRQ